LKNQLIQDLQAENIRLRNLCAAIEASPVQRVLDRHVRWRLKAMGIMDRVIYNSPGALDEMKAFVESSRTRMIEARNLDSTNGAVEQHG
jgi:hypothetical protein